MYFPFMAQCASVPVLLSAPSLLLKASRNLQVRKQHNMWHQGQAACNKLIKK